MEWSYKPAPRVIFFTGERFLCFYSGALLGCRGGGEASWYFFYPPHSPFFIFWYFLFFESFPQLLGCVICNRIFCERLHDAAAILDCSFYELFFLWHFVPVVRGLRGHGFQDPHFLKRTVLPGLYPDVLGIWLIGLIAGWARPCTDPLLRWRSRGGGRFTMDGRRKTERGGIKYGLPLCWER